MARALACVFRIGYHVMNSTPHRDFESAEFQPIDPCTSGIPGGQAQQSAPPAAARSYLLHNIPRKERTFTRGTRCRICDGSGDVIKTSIELDAAMVMPGYVHLILRLLEPYHLPRCFSALNEGRRGG
ncbi:MAG: hypothetical protein JO166_00240 [Deltaproteobacteria bacterium]|nr:hypothetical protein [Deltaproteobacteria bacterium]